MVFESHDIRLILLTGEIYTISSRGNKPSTLYRQCESTIYVYVLTKK